LAYLFGIGVRRRRLLNDFEAGLATREGWTLAALHANGALAPRAIRQNSNRSSGRSFVTLFSSLQDVIGVGGAILMRFWVMGGASLRVTKRRVVIMSVVVSS